MKQRMCSMWQCFSFPLGFFPSLSHVSGLMFAHIQGNYSEAESFKLNIYIEKSE